MAIDFDSPAAYSRNDPALGPLLRDLQGNILVGHGREHVALLLLQFTCSSADAREASRMMGNWVTSAERQSAAGAQFASTRERSYWPRAYSEYHVNFYLSASGYAKLGIGDDQLPSDPRFRSGMAASANTLGDSQLGASAAPYGTSVDAIVLVADSSLSQVDSKSASLGKYMARFNIAVFAERGRLMRAPNQAAEQNDYRSLEFFGFKDGRSQPLFFEDEIAEERSKGGIDEYSPAAPLKLAIVKDPGSSTGYGSYFVYRKLEQDLRAFASHVAGSADAAATMVGRYPDGRTLKMKGEPSPADPPNNFNYSDDPTGKLCPLHAHIRAVNPRDAASAAQRIVRRSIPYDECGRGQPPWPTVPPEQLPNGGLGLLFMCFQAEVAGQFEALQRADRLAGGTGKARIDNFVKLLGGEYLFAPSPSFLRGL